MGGRRGVGGQPMWIIFTFYNISIKSANVDKGGGVDAYPQNVDKKIIAVKKKKIFQK